MITQTLELGNKWLNHSYKRKGFEKNSKEYLKVSTNEEIKEMHLFLIFSPLFLQYEFSPQTLCCYGKQLCTIPRDAAYYSYQNR